jgi:hypothetical protein
MPTDPGPQQTDDWPLTCADLNQSGLPAWIIWDRRCESKGIDDERCPRRLIGRYFGVMRCDHHWPVGVPIRRGQLIG